MLRAWHHLSHERWHDLGSNAQIPPLSLPNSSNNWVEKPILAPSLEQTTPQQIEKRRDSAIDFYSGWNPKYALRKSMVIRRPLAWLVAGRSFPFGRTDGRMNAWLVFSMRAMFGVKIQAGGRHLAPTRRHINGGGSIATTALCRGYSYGRSATR